MPTLDLGSCKQHPLVKKHQRGFTLLELLVVLVVLAIATGMIVVQGTPSDGRYLQSEAQRLAQILRIGQQHAMLTSKNIRFSASEEQFQFEAFDGNRWQSVTDEPTLRPRNWDTEGVEVTLFQAGEEVDFITLEPQADLTQRTLRMLLRNTEIEVASNAAGRFVVSQPTSTMGSR